jgi:tRNA-dihydrouridine synthase A
MMGYTDRHARYLYRLISPSAILYTEMVVASAILHGDRSKLLRFNEQEQPLALQLGGSSPHEMQLAARFAEDCGFQEVNINVGCPSDRVQSGKIGACLMREPGVVAECVDAMKNAVDIPVTVKTRTGIDEMDDYQYLHRFVSEVTEAGCATFIVHARKAWLKGLSPKQNRDVPPLHYERVYQLKDDFPDLEIVINGGVKTAEEVKTHLGFVDGVMLGREITRNPWLLAKIESEVVGTGLSDEDRSRVLNHYFEYIDNELRRGTSIHILIKPLSGMFHGLPGARQWRKLLTDLAQGRSVDTEKIPQLTEAAGTFR